MPPSFPFARQDKNAFNSGDCVKVVFDDAARAFLGRAASLEATLIDSHAGAGCYPVLKSFGPVAQGDSYFNDVALIAAQLTQLGVSINPPPKGATAALSVRFVGVAAMILSRHPTITRYEGFELDRGALARLNVTLSTLGLPHQAQQVDGWAGTKAAIASARVDHPLLLLLDPFKFDLSATAHLNDVLTALATRGGPALIGVFNPGRKDRFHVWDDWNAVEDLVRKWARTSGWACEAFALRKSLGGKSTDPHGRHQHFSMILASTEATAVAAAVSGWSARIGRDAAFAKWTNV